MRLKIIHETEYKFSTEIFPEPHSLRFKPKNRPYLKLQSFGLQIFPEPAGISEQIDIENNTIHFCWFNDMTDRLDIRAESVLEISDHNPFNFIFYPTDFSKLPFSYNDSQNSILYPALNAMELSGQLTAYGKKICDESGSETGGFLANLVKKIHSDFTVKSREKGRPLDPDSTFEKKEGSCRDLAWMCIHLLRQMGIASKFISGYYYIPGENPEYELHAWLEVFLPGAGWFGIDPSTGLVTGNLHIPAAAGTSYENTMPVTGSIRGSASSDLKTNINFEIID